MANKFYIRFCLSRGSVKVSYVIVVVAAVKQTVGEQVVSGLYFVLVKFVRVKQIREGKHKSRTVNFTSFVTIVTSFSYQLHLLN